ncbi:MAG: hypothetical protein CR971_00400 [candidate division SR1 bacterium]|nr:MAG: hypothetical protein CR971_00400 [candidate division SR1 bacterium]
MTTCIFCEEGTVVKNGQLSSGGQRYKCKSCDKQFHSGGTRKSYDPSFKETVVQDYLHDKTSARKVASKYHISTSTLLQWSKQHKTCCEKCKL